MSDKFKGVERVVRVPCRPTCGHGDCPQHIPPGTYGTVIPYSPETMNWDDGAKVVKQAVWRIEWDGLGGWWTMEHCMESEDGNFPDGVWTE